MKIICYKKNGTVSPIIEVMHYISLKLFVYELLKIISLSEQRKNTQLLRLMTFDFI